MKSNENKQKFPGYNALNTCLIRGAHPIKMPTKHTDTQVRLNTLITCFAITVDTLEVLANGLNAAFLEAIANTTRSLLKNIEVNHL
jgi:hypothetical protein